ncbi:MAG: hypothetical protein LBC52_02530 [Treponema sp.]|jgi:hypothetical protein|nr:hypothetical protein [Treponema sp.]
MKKTILFTLFLGLFAVVIPGTSLFADIGLGSRFDVGLDLFAIPTSEYTENDEVSIFPIIPLIDAGLYGQYTFGMLNMGIGLRAFSLIVLNVFSPSIYAELNLWRLTLNAQITGGALYVFPLYLIAGPYFIPELSVWYTLNKSKSSQMRLGVGALTLMSTQAINEEVIRDVSNNLIFYIAFKAVFPSNWMKWKRES